MPLVPRCRKYYGVAGSSFNGGWLRNQRSVKQLRKLLSGWRNRYVRDLKAKAQAERSKTVATVNWPLRDRVRSRAVGHSIRHRTLWNKKELLQAILSCQLDGLRCGKDGSIVQADPSVAGLRRKLVRVSARTAAASSWTWMRP